MLQWATLGVLFATAYHGEFIIHHQPQRHRPSGSSCGRWPIAANSTHLDIEYDHQYAVSQVSALNHPPTTHSATYKQTIKTTSHQAVHQGDSHQPASQLSCLSRKTTIIHLASHQTRWRMIIQLANWPASILTSWLSGPPGETVISQPSHLACQGKTVTNHPASHQTSKTMTIQPLSQLTSQPSHLVHQWMTVTSRPASHPASHQTSRVRLWLFYQGVI